MWTRIGVKTSVDAMAPPVFFKNRDSYAFSAYLAGWSVTSGEMSNALTSLLVTRNPEAGLGTTCLLYTSPSPRDVEESRMPSSA